MIFAGVDLAWGEGTADRPPNETGLAAIDITGTVLAAGWTRGLDPTAEWLGALAGDVLAFVDAPLVVTNPGGQRPCETQVGQRYGRWKVSANTSNLGSPRLAGVTLRRQLEAAGWRTDDGLAGPPAAGRSISETYPYTTLVGAPEFGFAPRPRYKRPPRGMPSAQWRPIRAAACDELIDRLAGLATADPPLRLDSHPVTAALREPSPLADAPYKHREDLIDAVLAAWTAALWARHGTDRCQVLGVPTGTPAATIIAPALPSQRR
jgi:predicted RNase H-like nuclease